MNCVQIAMGASVSIGAGERWASRPLSLEILVIAVYPH